MNSQELLEWICALVLVTVSGGAIVFAWVKAIDAYLALIKRFQGDTGERA